MGFEKAKISIQKRALESRARQKQGPSRNFEYQDLGSKSQENRA